MPDAQLIPVHDVLEERIGKRMSPPTVWRWCTKGARGVVLESRVVGHVRYTTYEWFDDFVAAQNPDPPAEETNDRTPVKKQRLEAAGLI